MQMRKTHADKSNKESSSLSQFDIGESSLLPTLSYPRFRYCYHVFCSPLLLRLRRYPAQYVSFSYIPNHYMHVRKVDARRIIKELSKATFEHLTNALLLK